MSKLINYVLRKDLESIKNIDFTEENINYIPQKGSSALHYACLNDDFEIVRYLIANNADIHIKNEWDITAIENVVICINRRMKDKYKLNSL